MVKEEDKKFGTKAKEVALKVAGYGLVGIALIGLLSGIF